MKVGRDWVDVEKDCCCCDGRDCGGGDGDLVAGEVRQGPGWGRLWEN